MHSTNHISKSICLTVIQLFQVSSPICTLYTAISHVIIVLKRWISHLSYIYHWTSHEAQPFKCVNQMRSCNVQFASVTRNPEMTVLFAVSPHANFTQLP